MNLNQGTDIMYKRLDEYEQNFRKLSPEEKALFFYAYSVARVDSELGSLRFADERK